MTINHAQEGIEYIIKSVETDDPELDAFLFSLGCYSGERVTLVSKKTRGCVVKVKDGRYSIDKALAESIKV